MVPGALLEAGEMTGAEEKLGRFDPRPDANKALWMESGSILFFFFLSLLFLWSFLINHGSKISGKYVSNDLLEHYGIFKEGKYSFADYL